MVNGLEADPLSFLSPIRAATVDRLALVMANICGNQCQDFEQGDDVINKLKVYALMKSELEELIDEASGH